MRNLNEQKEVFCFFFFLLREQRNGTVSGGKYEVRKRVFSKMKKIYM